MNKKTLTLLVAAAFAAPTLASATDFTGFGAAVELQLKSTGAQYTESYVEPGYSNSWSEDFGGNQDVIGALNVWYGFNVTPSVVVQIGATYDLGDTEGATWSFNYPGYSQSSTFEESDHYSIYVAPGYRVTPKTLVYGKIAYHGMKGEESWSDSDGNSGTYFSEDFSGWGFGAGVSTMLTNNFFLYVEAQHVMYDEETIYSNGDPVYTYTESVEPSSTIGSIGIGWNF
jgi:opacity protein-like surface antigen